MALTLNAAAQDYSDAANFFDNKAWGWATCTDDAGSPYTLNGGMGAAQPKTVILKSNGGDNASAITAAISNYDIIVLDGSNGVFTINAQMKIDNAKNKTIVGRNNAELATKFFLTQEDITYLKNQGLDKYSSTDQYTGTLPNGETVTCDKRAFFTKKAMMELEYQKSGQYALPNKAGIFQFNETCENVIVRNITFRGPGAVDIDGVDLLYDAYAKHLWVDHCTFIDSQDGALDTRGSYNTYTWNHFYYTNRSYSHAYTCGQGWVKDHSDVLHITWGYNMWGAGCNRRLPQCDDSYIHLVNNYHNCQGNSAGMTLNSYVKGLVEGNYSAPGVNSPLTGSGANRNITVVDNSFSYSNVGPTVTVPYTYSKISYTDVPTVLTAKHGAGATLDGGMYMPGVTQTLSEETFGFFNDESEVYKGKTVAVKVKNLLGVEYTLTSSNSDVLKIVNDNSAIAVGEGQAELKATVNDAVFGSYEATYTLTVKDGGASSSEDVLYYHLGTKDNTITFSDGATLQCTNSSKTLDPASNITYEDGNTYKSIKLSNGAQNIFTAPAGKLPITKVKFYSYINIDAPNRTPYWKEVGGVDYSEDYTLLKSYKDTENPDVVEFPISGTNSFTFTNTGEQLCFLMVVTYGGATDVKCAEAVQAPQPSALRSYRNVIGQEVAPTAKGIVIVNGQKFYNK